MKTKVTIGLCVKNAAKVIRTAFETISIQDYPHEFLKLVIVDNGSTDNTSSLAMEFAKETDIQTVITSSKGKGLGATRQVALDNAEGDYIVWVDDDLVLSKEGIRKHVEFMEKNPNVGAARGVSNKSDLQSTLLGGIDGYIALLFPQLQNPKEIGAGGAIFRLEALRSIGGFDLQIKGAGEDIDISRRVRKAGWKLATNNSVTCYSKHTPTTLKGFWKRNIGYGYGNYFIFHKYKDARSLIQYFPPFAILAGLKMTHDIYCVTKMKKVFVFFIIHSLSIIIQSIGFTRAYLSGYGHEKRI